MEVSFSRIMDEAGAGHGKIDCSGRQAFTKTLGDQLAMGGYGGDLLVDVICVNSAAVLFQSMDLSTKVVLPIGRHCRQTKGLRVTRFVLGERIIRGWQPATALGKLGPGIPRLGVKFGQGRQRSAVGQGHQALHHHFKFIRHHRGSLPFFRFDLGQIRKVWPNFSSKK